MALLTTSQVVVRITIIVTGAEFLIMLTLAALRLEIDHLEEAVLDSVLLALLTTPSIYLWVIRPFVQARNEALAQISHLAFTDPLTNLANRRHLYDQLEKVIAGNYRHRICGALLLIDLDGFKSVNDVYGHDAGDALLVEVAKRIKSIIRSEDLTCRLGGDEFVVLVSDLDADEHVARDKALQLSGKLIALISKPLLHNGLTLHVGASAGVRILGPEKTDAETVLQEADHAMYKAKNTGGGHSVVFERD